MTAEAIIYPVVTIVHLELHPQAILPRPSDIQSPDASPNSLRNLDPVFLSL